MQNCLVFEITPLRRFGRRGRIFLVKMVSIHIVIFYLCVGLTMSATDSYKAGTTRIDLGSDAYAALIREAARSDVDILLLPPSAADYSDKVVKTISTAAKEHNIYVVTQLLEKIRCEEKSEVIRNNLVFNRQGSIISVYRKPLDATSSCNVTTLATEIGSFITDFGVTFGVLMAEDLVLQNLEGLDVKNFVLLGNFHTEIAVLAAPQFFTTWAYTTNANLLSTSGVFAGKAGPSGKGGDVIVAELKKDGEASITNPTSTVRSHFSEDLSQFIIKPLDLAASRHGVKETVCHGQFCCQFYVKTSSTGSENSVNYGLAAFDGVLHYGGSHHIGTQNCGLVSCAGSYKRSCDVGSVNSTNVIFDEIKITGNFKTKDSAQYPIILTTDLSNNRFQINKKCMNHTNEVTVNLKDSQKLLNFGILGRDFTKDYNSKTVVSDLDGLTYNLSDYINSDNVLEFFDYMWIKLRIPIVVVSIYILEMM